MPENLPAWVAIVNDTRLTADARICALQLLSLGDGEHEVSQRRWRSILNSCGRERAQEALASLEEFGLVARQNGGSRPDRYELLCAGKPAHKILSAGIPAHNQNLSAGKPAHNGVYEPEFLHIKPRARDAVGDGVVEEGEEGETRARASGEFEIDPHADAALDDRFTGCRGAIRDALTRHVPPDFHYPLVMSLLSYIEQARRLVDARGRTIPPDQVAALIASCLNELGPEIRGARNPTRKITANLHGFAGRVNERRTADRETPPDGLGVEAGELLSAWADLQPVPPSASVMGRQGEAARRLCDAHGLDEIRTAAIGIARLFPHSKGEPWDLVDLERKFPKALQAAMADPSGKPDVTDWLDRMFPDEERKEAES